MKVILTGATGMVGEGVLMESLVHPDVEKVLMVNRKASPMKHPKLTELLVADFLHLEDVEAQLAGYDACFYCAGISSAGMSEADYTRVTYDTPLHVAQTLARLNPNMVFDHVSGSHTDGTEKGGVMWARVKGRAENALMKLPFKGVYNFRPGFMNPTDGQKNVKTVFRAVTWLYPALRVVAPNYVITLKELAHAMIHSVQKGAPKQVLEIVDIKALAKA